MDQGTLPAAAQAAAHPLAGLDGSPSAYLRASREVEAGNVPDLQPVRVAVVASFTPNQLQPYLVVEAALRGMKAEVYLAPFNQLEQELLDPGSGLHRFDPEVVLVATRLEELAPDLVQRFASFTREDLDTTLQGADTRLGSLLKGFRARSSATLLVLNFAAPRFVSTGFADALLEVNQASARHRANEALGRLARSVPGTFVVDFARVVEEVGTRNAYDPRLFYLGRIPLSAAGHLALGERLARTIRAVRSTPAKCLVVDLDNTLWGGVLGEDGVGGIKTGDDYPGNAFRDFQRAILALRDRGILLAIASKNNEEDVAEVFRRHPDLLVTLDHFAARQIHWNDKASSLRAIAAELNIGVDSLAFFDDNPAERAWVQDQLPEVTVVDVPADPTRYVEALDRCGAFDHLLVSDEDRVRAEQYLTEGRRREVESSAGSLEEFLQELGIVVTIGRTGPDTLPRVTQLIGKTNQFNLTTRRYTSAELQARSDNGELVLWMRVSDRFGDHGLVGVAIACPDGDGTWRIDTFLLSCRVIGRRVEDAMVAVLSGMAHGRGATRLMGEFIPTPKNRPAEGFYERLGFAPADSEGQFWALDLSEGPLPIPDLVTVTLADADD